MEISIVLCDSYSVVYVILILYLTICDCKLDLVRNFDFQTSAKTGGIAVVDFDRDGIFEVIIAVLDGPNLILQFSHERKSYVDIGEERVEFSPVRDPNGQTITICACDVDGDGSEEIFILNQKSVLDNPADTQPNRLLKYNNGTVKDLLDNPNNIDMASSYSGGFVSCIDHDGDGTYGIFMGSYINDGSGVYKLFSVENKIGGLVSVFRDISEDLGLDIQRDGTSCVIGPLLNEGGYSDIFVTNGNEFYVGSKFYRSNNSNTVFQNQRNGRFVEVAKVYDLQGDFNSYDSAAIADLNGDGMMDLLLCSFYGPAWKYIRNPENGAFQKGVADNFTKSAGCKNLLVADFDNDGKIEVFKDDQKNDGSNVNAVFEAVNTGLNFDVNMQSVDIDDHLRNVNVQGITVADLNGDGLLEMIVAHKQHIRRTVSIYQSSGPSFNNWLRVMPLTLAGAPSRGSMVTLTFNDFSTKTIVIGSGCSRVCQIEPIAHFGLGNMTAFRVEVKWPDGHVVRQFLSAKEARRTLQVSYTGQVVRREDLSAQKHQTSSTAFKETYSFSINLCSLFIYFISVVLKFRLFH